MRRSHGILRALFLLLAASAAPPGAGAQLVPLRTVPLATGDQFLLHPSERVAMGGVSIALDDRSGDPFSNPARGALLEGRTLFVSPTYYGVSENGGAGRTLPLTLLAGSSTWFGGLSVVVQEVEGPGVDRSPWPALADPALFPPGERALSEASAPNLYVSGVVGRDLGAGWAAGASVLRAELSAMDGVEHLFPRRRFLDQDGHLSDLRFGVFRSWEDGGRLDAVIVHRRLRMTYDVGRVRFVPLEPDPADPPDPWVPPPGRVELVTEANPDHTNTTGAHVGWVRPLDTPGWRLGATVTLNRKSHPKIPNYELMSIPRDPGDTWASAFGLGLARQEEGTSYGVDVVFQPAWTETWVEAIEPVETRSGATIPAGGRTVENEFFFRNLFMALGVGHDFGPAEAQLGLQLRAYAYDLEQTDRVEERRRNQEESWHEWTPTWGGSVGLGELRVRYEGRLTTGTGRPGSVPEVLPTDGPVLQAGPGVDFLPAPRGPLTLRDARVWTHRLSLAVPVS